MSSHPHPSSSPGNADPLSMSGSCVWRGPRPGWTPPATGPELGSRQGGPAPRGPHCLWRWSSCRGNHTTVPTSVPRHRCRLVEILSGLGGRGGQGSTPHAAPAKGRRPPELWAAWAGPSQSPLLAGPVPGSGTQKGEGRPLSQSFWASFLGDRERVSRRLKEQEGWLNHVGMHRPQKELGLLL